MTPSGTNALRRVAGSLFLVDAVAFAIAATVLSSTFNWPDILRQPASVVLPEFVAGGTGLIWTWFATAWAYAILAVTQAAVDAAWTAQHQFGGALLGEHLGQLMAIGWSVTISIIILRTRALSRWLGLVGLAVSALYLLNQGDILATAVAGFPVWELAGLLGSTAWGLWVAALGVTLLLPRANRHGRNYENRADTATDAAPAMARPAAGTVAGVR